MEEAKEIMRINDDVEVQDGFVHVVRMHDARKNAGQA